MELWQEARESYVILYYCQKREFFVEQILFIYFVNEILFVEEREYKITKSIACFSPKYKETTLSMEMMRAGQSICKDQQNFVTMTLQYDTTLLSLPIHGTRKQLLNGQILVAC